MPECERALVAGVEVDDAADLTDMEGYPQGLEWRTFDVYLNGWIFRSSEVAGCRCRQMLLLSSRHRLVDM